MQYFVRFDAYLFSRSPVTETSYRLVYTFVFTQIFRQACNAFKNIHKITCSKISHKGTCVPKKKVSFIILYTLAD